MNNFLAVGAAIDFTGVDLPFTVPDLIGSGNALLQYVGPFILLGLAFVLVPKLIALFRNAFSAAKNR